MKVAVIAHGLSDGGAERVASIVANYFAKIGHEVLYIAVYSPEREYFLDDRITYQFLEDNSKNKATRFLNRATKLNKLIEDFSCDIAVSFIIRETVLACLRKKVPFVYSLRIDPAEVTRTKLAALLCKLCYSNAKSVIFQTNDARAFFKGKIYDHGIVIGNPLTKNLPYWNQAHHENSIISACRLDEQKNLKMLISAFARFHDKHPEYRLKIYGKGPQLPELQELSRKLSVEQHVDFPGHTKEIHNIMANSAIFALTSDFEGLSNSMLEALAIGLPTVCTDCPPGGAAEYITDGVNGMLVPVRDVDALYSKLCIMAENPALCENMSNNSRKIRDVLDESVVMEKWDNCLK